MSPRRNRCGTSPQVTGTCDAVEARRVSHLLVNGVQRLIQSNPAQVGRRALGFYNSLVEAHEVLGQCMAIKSQPFEQLGNADRRALLEQLCVSIAAVGRNGKSGLDRRLDWISDLMGLNDAESTIFDLIVRLQLLPEYSVLHPALSSNGHRRDGIDPVVMSLMTGLAHGTVRRVIDPNGPLVRAGLLSENDPYDFSLEDRLKKFLLKNVSSPGAMRSALLPIAAPSTLALEDFAHLQPAISDVIALARHACRTGERANILLYGVPGTGKTELARLMAQIVGLDAIEVGNADDDGDEPGRGERLLHLRMCRALCGPSHPAILIIDEAEDLFVPQGMQTASKLWLNRLVESASGVHIWIVNSLCELGEPVVRRMDFALRFATPPAKVQKELARKTTMRRGRPASDETVGRLAAFKTSPAILATAAKTARKIRWDEKRVIRVSRDLARATGRFSDRPPATEGYQFDPALSRASENLPMLTQRLSAAEMPWSMLLSGPPGTGKSAFARHLAEKSARELIVKSASDLLGCFVGETEKAMAAAFAEAEEADAILLIDEADSFLSDRSRTRHQWEASMINEMLRQMESNRARFIATTNRSDVLDPATARRFSLAVEFLPMTTEQARAMFCATFGVRAPEGLEQLHALTPGDFAQAKRRAVLLGEQTPANFLRWLREALANRHISGPMGF